MGVAVGNINSTETKATQITAIQPIGPLQTPSRHGPGLKSGANWRRKIGIAYAIYRPMTAIEVTATYATKSTTVGTARIKEHTTARRMALRGVRPLFSLCHRLCPGTAPSREKA